MQQEFSGLLNHNHTGRLSYRCRYLSDRDQEGPGHLSLMPLEKALSESTVSRKRCFP